MNGIETSSMASLLMPSSTAIASHMISKKDSDSDSSLSVEEMGISEDTFASYDSDSDGLVSQTELTAAIETAMSNNNGDMPSKEEFQEMLSEFGFEAPSQPQSSSSSQSELVASILEDYDSNNLSESDAQSIVAALQSAGIEPSEELANAMEEAGFDAQEVGTLAGVGPQGGGMGPPPGGGGGGSAEETFDSLDTNEDGVVSLEELEEAYGTSDDESTELSSTQQNALDNLSLLMGMLKMNREEEDSSVDSKNFDGLLKAINNTNNNSEINTYLQNETAVSRFGYA